MHITRHSTIFTIKTIILLAICLFASSVFGATLSVTPGTGVYTAGQTFTTRITVNTAGEKVNAAEGTLSFKSTELSVVNVSKGSVFNLWTAEPSFSNSAGTVTFSGGTPAGYSGSAGTVLSVTFRAKNAGSPRVSFTDGAVLAADGRGTNVLTSMNGASYTITAASVAPAPETIEYIAPANTPSAAKITSATHPDMEAWYTDATAELVWTLPSGVTAVRTLLDEHSGSIPTKVYDNPISKISLTDLEEGVQYFHLQLKNSDGWGRVAHYRLAVDSEKPTAFDITLSEDADLSSPEQTLILSVEEKTSKVTRFLVQVDGADPYEYLDVEETGELTLSALEPGHHSVIIEAFDAAGNSLISTFSFGILAFDKPQFTEYPSELSQEVIPVIKGITRPNAEVIVSVTKLGSDTQEITVQSTDSGEFIYIPESRFSLGVYELTAVAVDQYGAKSEVSDAVRIAVQQPGYVRIGSYVISVLSIMIPLLALLLLLIIGGWYLASRLRKLRKGVTKESREALVMLQSEFKKLHALVQTESDVLSASRKTKKLTKSETSLIESVQAAMRVAQKNVEKEITDVEDIVD